MHNNRGVVLFLLVSVLTLFCSSFESLISGNGTKLTFDLKITTLKDEITYSLTGEAALPSSFYARQASASVISQMNVPGVIMPEE